MAKQIGSWEFENLGEFKEPLANFKPGVVATQELFVVRDALSGQELGEFKQPVALVVVLTVAPGRPGIRMSPDRYYKDFLSADQTHSLNAAINQWWDDLVESRFPED